VERRLYFTFPRPAQARRVVDEQRIPLRHGEVVVMVDVPADRVHEVEGMVSRQHPEAGVGGVGWHIHGLNA
jgi:hypothetical protein